MHARTFALVLAALVVLSIPAAVGCGPVECFRAINCVETCGGRVVQSGCFACPGGTFDDIMCRPDSGPDAPVPTGDAPSPTPYHLVRHDCGPTDGPALSIGLYGSVDPACGGDPSRESVQIFVYGTATSTVPPTAGSVVTSTAASPAGEISACPGGTPPCVTSRDFQVTFDSYTDGVEAAGTYTVTFGDGSTRSGSFDAMWCERVPVMCG